MKILESQSAVLSNYEVYQHVVDLKKRNKKTRHRGPGNYETVLRELKTWLEAPPSPLSQKPITYRPESIPTLLERLRPFDLSKGEVIMILNLRPDTVPALNTIIEDMSERFTEEQLEGVVNIIAEVLGYFEPPAEADQQNGDADGADVTMNDDDAAAAAPETAAS